MNDTPNTKHHEIGALVIHDADAKCDRMLQRVLGYTRKGLVETQYLDQTVSTGTYVNPIDVLHDPMRPDIRARWKDANGSPAMLLWLLTGLNPTGHDVMIGFVVRAQTEEQARKIASENDKFERVGRIWLNPEWTSCEVLTDSGEPGVILSEYRYG